MRLVAAASSRRGPSHDESGEPNQDAIAIRGCRRGWIVAACDGLGSAPYSQVGAQQAARTCLQVLSGRTEPAGGTTAAIRTQWLQRIAPRRPAESGTTCLWASVDESGFCQVGQLGDGMVLMRSNGRLIQVTPQRQWFGNQTHSLHDPTAEDHWHVAEATFACPGDGAVLMTDGVADDIDPTMLEDFFSALYASIHKRGRRRSRRWLDRELDGWTTPMHGDDKSIAMIFRTR